MTVLTVVLALLLVHPGLGYPLQEAADMISVDVQPKPVKSVNPVYPPQARQERIEGVVYVKALIDTSGTVAKMEILKSDHQVLNEPSLQAVKAWRFSPALKGNTPVATWITIPFKYKLSEGGEKPKGGTSSNDAETLQQRTLDILQGKGSPQWRPLLADDASFVDGGTFGSLHETLSGHRKGTLLAEEQGRRSTVVQTRFSPDGWTATVVIKTEGETGGTPHWHTVQWEKGKGGTWTIRHWHASRD